MDWDGTVTLVAQEDRPSGDTGDAGAEPQDLVCEMTMDACTLTFAAGPQTTQDHNVLLDDDD